VVVAGSDAKGQHRRAIATLQSTLVEHEEQLKDMERRTVTVTDVLLCMVTNLTKIVFLFIFTYFIAKFKK